MVVLLVVGDEWPRSRWMGAVWHGAGRWAGVRGAEVGDVGRGRFAGNSSVDRRWCRAELGKEKDVGDLRQGGGVSFGGVDGSGCVVLAVKGEWVVVVWSGAVMAGVGRSNWVEGWQWLR
ncbi:putative basic proline-rich protein-like isoform X1 [Iris pallida]|uniref:Basic proline-rich protein-like isoform X1 n=1 Tax=Iris pallida TaxID=29817 RepID=A0AAX6IIR7_IRIPA|nr:putative basic proline-rich protein-like isoform X1 [Iris pallida]